MGIKHHDEILLTIDEAKRYLDVSERWILALCERGDLTRRINITDQKSSYITLDSVLKYHRALYVQSGALVKRVLDLEQRIDVLESKISGREQKNLTSMLKELHPGMFK